MVLRRPIECTLHFGKLLPGSAGASGGLFYVYYNVFVVHVEEPGLERRFGISYRAYNQLINRWLPRFKTDSRE
jgi:protein-S-isoprenylcysteine O-methyltransferase Ste14